MESTSEQQQQQYVPSQRRRKRSQRGQRLARSLVHIDGSTKAQLVDMSTATGIPQIQLLALAVNLLANANNQLVQEQLASEANNVAL